jgi:hypothetical protein
MPEIRFDEIFPVQAERTGDDPLVIVFPLGVVQKIYFENGRMKVQVEWPKQRKPMKAGARELADQAE